MQHACSHYNAFCSITWQTRLCLRAWQQKITTAICNKRFQTTLKLRTHQSIQSSLKPLLHCGTKETRQNDPSRTRRTHELPFIAGCSHLTRKTQGFALQLPPQNQPHATCMQPLHCVLQHNLANALVSTHMAAEHYHCDLQQKIPNHPASKEA